MGKSRNKICNSKGTHPEGQDKEKHYVWNDKAASNSVM